LILIIAFLSSTGNLIKRAFLPFEMSAFANEIFKNVSAGELCALIIASVHSTGLDEPADQRDAEEHTSGKKHSVLLLDN
jgi:hypothetical protein